MNKFNPVSWKNFDKGAAYVSDMHGQSSCGVNNLIHVVDGDGCLNFTPSEGSPGTKHQRENPSSDYPLILTRVCLDTVKISAIPVSHKSNWYVKSWNIQRIRLRTLHQVRWESSLVPTLSEDDVRRAGPRDSASRAWHTRTSLGSSGQFRLRTRRVFITLRSIQHILLNIFPVLRCQIKFTLHETSLMSHIELNVLQSVSTVDPNHHSG